MGDFIITIYCDGACYGNPGPMGIGIVIWMEGKKIKEISEFIGNGTNNIAEYSAIIRALKEIKQFGEKKIILRSDSQLIIRQLNGEYKIRENHLKMLKAEVDKLSVGLAISFEHIERERNKLADRLSKDALK